MVKRISLVFMVVVALASCGPKAIDVQARSATAMAVAVNKLTPMLRDMQKKEGLDAIERAPDKASAFMWVKTIEDRWKPLWDVHKVLAAAQDAYATALEQGGNAEAAYGAVQNAFCNLVPLLPKGIPVAPIADVHCGGGGNR